jgi:hypothetical protein
VVYYIKGGTWGEIVGEWGAKEDICTREGGTSRRMERMHNADLHDLNILVRKPTRMRWLGRVACIGVNKSGTTLRT